MATAIVAWERDGVPERPDSWLRVAARNKAIDRLRREKMQREILEALESDHWAAAREAAPDDRVQEDDDLLTLIFTCCHPALAPESRVALTLKAVGGLSTREIARAFLQPEATTAQRLVRTKRKIREAGISFTKPRPEQREARLDAVLSVIYLIFNEGYLASSGEALMRTDLSTEGIRLGRMLAALQPQEPEVLGLLSLMLLQDSRRRARTRDGELVVLEEQDRGLWDAALIHEGFGVLERALSLRSPGPYQVQAAIASEHARAASAADTDWRRIVAFYGELKRMAPGPVVALNHAAAVGLAYGPEEGLRLMETLGGGELRDYYLFHAARADLLRRSGAAEAAEDAYRRALALCEGEPERRYLRRRLAEVNGSGG